MRYVLSKSGRKMPLPKNEFVIRVGTTNRKVINDLKIINQWLIDQSIMESVYNSDDFNHVGFSNTNLRNLSQADIDGMNLYLFGEVCSEVEILSD